MIFAKYLVPAVMLGTILAPMAAKADTPQHPHSINARLRDQQQRIHSGVGSEQLTRREQYRLQERDARIHVQEDRARLSGGKFTAAERRRIQRELNHSSSAIYKQKHDAQVRP